MQISARAWRVGTAVMAGLGLAAVGLALRLEWEHPDFRLGPLPRMLMALAGAAILVLAGKWKPLPGRPGTAIRLAMIVLGASVLVYPTNLSLAAADVGGPVVMAAAGGGHMIPLLTVQLLPVLASQYVIGRSLRRWLILIVGVAVLSTALPLLGTVVLSVVGTILWLGSYLLAPTATWLGVRGTSGMVRRRAIVCGLASVVPVVIIALCTTLGAAGEILRLGADAPIVALMVGFSLGTSGTAVLGYGGTSAGESWMLRTRVILGLLAALLAAITLIVAIGGGLIATDAGLPGVFPLLIGVALTAGMGLFSVRLHGWASRQVDPAAEVAAELAALGDIAHGEYRQSVQQVLRRVVADTGLVLLVRASDGTWVDPLGTPTDPPAGGIRLAGTDREPRAIAVGSIPEAPGRLGRLGDCARLLQPAVLEASVQRESVRADAAAEAERRRLSQDLHDGLQGKLLGITLNLQLSGREIADPSARLLVEQTVDSLRDAVEEVRSLGAGRLPSVLVRGGLKPALSDLVRPLVAVTDLRVTERRFAPELEATGYFVVSEAVSNAVKHAQAERIDVVVEPNESGGLLVMVGDDGVGGADPRLGSGLRGLAERVSASGGLLVVRGGVPRGTVVEATLPCGS